MAETAQFVAKVHGRVQGVFFRQFVRCSANKLNIQGYVRNLADGNTLEVRAVGKKDNLEIFISNLGKGPQDAIVKEMEITWSDNSESYNDFIIRY